MHVLNEMYDANIRSYLLILETISKSCIAPEQVFSLCEDNKTTCMLMCQEHLILTLLSDTKYKCTSQSGNDFLVISSQKRYSKSCIRYYCENMCKIYLFKDFFCIFFW